MRFVRFVVFSAALLPAASASAQSAPVVQNARPSRYVLTQGAVVEGVPIGEDATYFVVRTAQGDVRIRKVDVARIEFSGAPAVAPPPPAVAAPPPTPVAAFETDDEREDRVERDKAEAQRSAAFWGGFLGFATVYGLTVGGAAIGSIFEPEAAWLYIPLAGPLLYGHYGQVNDLGWALLGMLTFFQGGAALALLVGAIIWAASKDPEDAEASLELANGVDLAIDARGLRLAWR